jgi:hypothetical protein
MERRRFTREFKLDQPCHQVGQRRLYLRRQPGPAGMPPISVRGSPANRLICRGAPRREAVCFVWRDMDLSPILIARET